MKYSDVTTPGIRCGYFWMGVNPHIVELKLNPFLRLTHHDMMRRGQSRDYASLSVFLGSSRDTSWISRWMSTPVVQLPISWPTIAQVRGQRALKVTTSSPVVLSLLTQWNIKILTYTRNLPPLSIKLKVKASIIVALKGLKSVQRSFRLDFVAKRSST